MLIRKRAKLYLEKAISTFAGEPRPLFGHALILAGGAASGKSRRILTWQETMSGSTPYTGDQSQRSTLHQGFFGASHG